MCHCLTLYMVGLSPSLMPHRPSHPLVSVSCPCFTLGATLLILWAVSSSVARSASGSSFVDTTCRPKPCLTGWGSMTGTSTFTPRHVSPSPCTHVHSLTFYLLCCTLPFAFLLCCTLPFAFLLCCTLLFAFLLCCTLLFAFLLCCTLPFAFLLLCCTLPFAFLLLRCALFDAWLPCCLAAAFFGTHVYPPHSGSGARLSVVLQS